MESDTTTLLLLFSLSFTRFCSKYIVTTTLNDRGLQDCRSSIVQYKMHAMLTAENRSLPGQKKNKNFVAAGIRAQVSTATTWNSHH